jgi:hypothetical protein
VDERPVAQRLIHHRDLNQVMRIEDGALRLAQIEAADHANTPRVRLFERLAEQIATRRQIMKSLVSSSAITLNWHTVNPHPAFSILHYFSEYILRE